MDNSISQKPILSSRTFWDTDLDKFDFERYANFAIVRVFERGLKKEVREIIKFYGNKKVISTLTSSKRLASRAFIFSRRLFHIPKEQYSCSK